MHDNVTVFGKSSSSEMRLGGHSGAYAIDLMFLQFDTGSSKLRLVGRW